MDDAAAEQVVYKVTRTPAGGQPTTLGYARGERDVIIDYFTCDEFRSGTSTNLEEIKVLHINPETLGERKELTRRRKELREELAGLEERLDIKE